MYDTWILFKNTSCSIYNPKMLFKFKSFIIIEIWLTMLLLFSHSVMSNSLQPYGLQHTRLPCPSLSPRVCSNSCHWVSDAIESSHPLSPPFLLPSIFPSIRMFSKESDLCIRWSFSFIISPSNEYSELISFRIDWLDLLAVQGTLKSLLQHHSSKASILQHSAFFMVQLSHPYMTTGKSIALNIWISVGTVMSLLLNMLSRFVITFLSSSKCLSSSCLRSPSSVTLEPKKIKSDTVSIFSPSISHEVMGPGAMILVFWMLSFKPAFSLFFFTFILFAFCHQGGVICISEVVGISTGNLDSSLCFIHGT